MSDDDRIRVISRFRKDSTTVPNWLISRADLSPTHRFTVVLLLMFEQNGESPTHDELAGLLGFKSSRNVRLYLDDLKTARILRTRQQPGMPSLYLIYNPNEPHQKAKKRHTPDLQIPPDPQIRGDLQIRGVFPHQDAINGDTPDLQIRGTRHDDDDSILREISDSVRDSSSCAASAKKSPLAAFLFQKGMGAALEFGALDFDAAVADFELRHVAGQSIPHIVRAWRADPPQPRPVVVLPPPALPDLDLSDLDDLDLSDLDPAPNALPPPPFVQARQIWNAALGTLRA